MATDNNATLSLDTKTGDTVLVKGDIKVKIHPDDSVDVFAPGTVRTHVTTPENPEAVEISYSKGLDAYKIFLGGINMALIKATRERPDFKSKEGEDLVAAILAAIPGDVGAITRYKNGKENDGPHGEPSYQRFYEDGKIAFIRYSQDGKYNNTPDGQPAIQGFSKSGQLIDTGRFINGLLNDGPNGEPACKDFSENGVVTRILHCRNGKTINAPDGGPGLQKFRADNGKLILSQYYKDDELNDGPNGEPASQHFDDAGKLTEAWRCKGDKFKKLGPLALLRARKKFKSPTVK